MNNVNRIFEAVEKTTGVTRDMIVSRIRVRDIYFARMIVTYELHRRGFSHEKVCKRVGVACPSSVTYQINGYRNERSLYFRACAKQVEELLSQ